MPFPASLSTRRSGRSDGTVLGWVSGTRVTPRPRPPPPPGAGIHTSYRYELQLRAKRWGGVPHGAHHVPPTATGATV